MSRKGSGATAKAVPAAQDAKALEADSKKAAEGDPILPEADRTGRDDDPAPRDLSKEALEEQSEAAAKGDPVPFPEELSKEEEAALTDRQRIERAEQMAKARAAAGLQPGERRTVDSSRDAAIRAEEAGRPLSGKEAITNSDRPEQVSLREQAEAVRAEQPKPAKAKAGAAHVGQMVNFHSLVRRAGLRDFAPAPAIVTQINPENGRPSLTVFEHRNTRYVDNVSDDSKAEEFWSPLK